MKGLTIFGDNSATKDIQSAIKSLITGRTPANEVRKRDIPGGGQSNYVNTYYMTRQAALLTGWRWSSECLREKFVPDEINPKEIGALMKVTLFDQDGFAFSHISWGSATVKRYKDAGKDHAAGDPLSIFNDLKSAYSDGIKKCLSYVGIANDVYGGKDMSESFFNDDETESNGIVKFDNVEARTVFDRYIKANKVRYDIVFRLLNVQSLNEISDWQAAYNKVKEWIEGGKKPA